MRERGGFGGVTEPNSCCAQSEELQNNYRIIHHISRGIGIQGLTGLKTFFVTWIFLNCEELVVFLNLPVKGLCDLSGTYCSVTLKDLKWWLIKETIMSTWEVTGYNQLNCTCDSWRIWMGKLTLEEKLNTLILKLNLSGSFMRSFLRDSMLRDASSCPLSTSE